MKLTPEQELRTALAMAILDVSDELTIEQLNKILDSVETLYAPILHKEYDKGYKDGQEYGRQEERSR